MHLQGGVATGHNVRHAGVISPERIVSESVGVVNLIRCCSSIDGVVSSTRFECVLPDIDDSHDFVRKSVEVPGFNWCLISIGWLGRGVTPTLERVMVVVVDSFSFQRVMMWFGLGLCCLLGGL